MSAAERIYQYARTKNEPVRHSDFVKHLRLENSTVAHELGYLKKIGLMQQVGNLYQAIDDSAAGRAWAFFNQKLKPTAGYDSDERRLR